MNIKEFTHSLVRERILKNWSMNYKGEEISGTYERIDDGYGYDSHEVEITDYDVDLTDEDIEKIESYVIENC